MESSLINSAWQSRERFWEVCHRTLPSGLALLDIHQCLKRTQENVVTIKKKKDGQKTPLDFFIAEARELRRFCWKKPCQRHQAPAVPWAFTKQSWLSTGLKSGNSTHIGALGKLRFANVSPELCLKSKPNQTTTTANICIQNLQPCYAKVLPL